MVGSSHVLEKCNCELCGIQSLLGFFNIQKVDLQCPMSCGPAKKLGHSIQPKGVPLDLLTLLHSSPCLSEKLFNAHRGEFRWMSTKEEFSHARRFSEVLAVGSFGWRCD